MYKYPDKAFDYVYNRFSTIGLIKYAFNWKKSRYVKEALVPWLEQQVGEAYSTGYLNNITARIMNNTKGDDYDAIAIKVLRFVKSYVTYVGDSVTWKVGEYWQTARETYDLRKGDCEDGGVFIYVLCRVCGIPANRLLLMAGDVKIGRTASTGGHCWCAYKPTFNPTVFAFLDWCYAYDSKGLLSRNNYFILRNDIFSSLAKRDDKYKSLWWSFNETQGFTSINSRNLGTTF